MLGLLPGIPEIELEPDLVLLIFLPPLLYAAAFFSDLRALRSDLRAITMTSIGLVLATIGVVAVVAHEAIGLSWPMAFVLGAIVSPTDPVAATAIMRQVGAPRRLVNIIEGESLVNDATALVAYRVAVAAAVGGSFSVLDAGLEFLGAAAGGIAIGLVVGFLVAEIRRRIDDAPTEITISLLTAYAPSSPPTASRACWRPSPPESTWAGGAPSWSRPRHACRLCCLRSSSSSSTPRCSS